MRQNRYEYLLNILAENGISVTQNRVVDCACGDGIGSGHLKEAGALMTAIDLGAEEVNTCLRKGLNAQQGDIRHLELPSDYCDLFFCCETLEHLIVSDCIKATSEIQRVTKPEGIICITVPKYKNVCFNKKNRSVHKTWVQRQDIEKWFSECQIIVDDTFIKDPENYKRANMVVVLKCKSNED